MGGGGYPEGFRSVVVIAKGSVEGWRPIGGERAHKEEWMEGRLGAWAHTHTQKEGHPHVGGTDDEARVWRLHPKEIS